jgi:Ca-activated chloride channel family protein
MIKGLTALLLGIAIGFAQEAVFKVDVRLVRLTATVKDVNGRAVGGLEPSDFTVYDNGAKQTISVFERHTSQPLSVVILLDASGSTGKEMKYQTDAVTRFTRALFKEGNPKDQAALLAFNWQVAELVGFSRNPDQFARATRRLKVRPARRCTTRSSSGPRSWKTGTGAAYSSWSQTGADTISSKTFHDARKAAHDADAVVYGILVVPITNDAGRHVAGENALSGISTSTGGKMFTPGMEGVDQAFEEILKDLRTQYLIGFYPKDVPLTKDAFHKIEIKASHP